MKLISLKIDGFKNLNTEIDFTKSEGISVFVGNNGSGKSNVLEAISAIFYGLYYSKTFDFEFELIYDITQEGFSMPMTLGKSFITKYKIQIKNELLSKGKFFLTFHLNGENVIIKKDEILKYLPSNIIALYSGEETRLYKKYYLKDYNKYINDIITSKKGVSENIGMNFIGKDFWNIALLTMTVSNYDLSNIIGDYKIDKLLFKFNESNILKFLNQNPNEVNSFIFSLSEIKNLNLNTFIETYPQSHNELFKLLSLAYLPKDENYRLIEKFDLELTNGKNTFLASCLSEGQKKQILIYFVTQILADKDSIILLDEPDSYIHVGNKEKLKNFFTDFIKDYGEGEIIMTTHSPTLVNTFKHDQIFDLEEGKIIGKERREVLKNLVGDSMSYIDVQKLLNTQKDILIVEGKTDEKYINIALKILKEDNLKYNELDFEFIFMGGTDGDILKGFSEKFITKDGQKIIAFFDRDSSGVNCITKATGISKNNFDKESFNTHKLKNIDIYFYPKKDGFTESNFEVEDYFKIETCRKFIFDEIKTFSYLKQKFNKTKFATYCEELPKEEFEGFKVLFDLILDIKYN